MKRLLPLLFLLPSVALILYARRAHPEVGPVPEDSYQLEIRVTTDGYTLPDEYEIRLCGQIVNSGRARLEFPKAGDVIVDVTLAARGAKTTAGVSCGVGEPREFTLKETSEPQRETIVVTREECEAAIAELKTAR